MVYLYSVGKIFFFNRTEIILIMSSVNNVHEHNISHSNHGIQFKLSISWLLHNKIHSKFITLYLFALYLVFSFAILFTNYSSNHISFVFLIKRIVYITLNGRSPNFHIMTKKEWNRRQDRSFETSIVLVFSLSSFAALEQNTFTHTN